MNTPDNFDELSRHKLAEREFPFEEAHWNDVQRSLNTQRQRKVAWLPWAIGAVLLLGVGAWWATSGAVEGDHTAQVAVPAGDNAAPAPGTLPRTTTGAEPTMSDEAPANTITTSAEPLASATGTTPNEPSAQGGTSGRNERDRRQVGVEQVSQEPGVDVPGSSEPDAIATGSNAGGQGGADNGNASPALTGSVIVVPPTGSHTGTESTIDQDVDATTGSPVPSTDGEGSEAPSIDGSAQNSGTTPTETVASNMAPSTDMPVVEEATFEAAASAMASAILDTTLAASEAAALPQTPNAARWEIGVLGGALSTWSTYTGGSSVQWTNALGKGSSAGFGVEMMRMGKNTGIGTGVHYTSYAERFSEADRFRTDVDYRNYYFLQFFDTTVTIVIGMDTVGGDTAYITQQVNTTISTLGNGIDTLTTTTLESAARTHVNVVSYLEIPLLFDAHLAQGRWSIGLRGGPFLGVLSGRRGALPNSAWDGYTDLADQPFRSLVFGYTARAYLRYRFNAAWSVGIEPCIRGQLVNAYSGGDVTRRSMGAGAMLSLSYTLR